MPTGLAQFHKALGAQQLAPVYLLAGEEPLLLLEAADALRARARAMGYGEREVLDAESGFDWNELARAAAGMSLFAARRLLDLRLPGGKPGKDGAAAIAEYCAAPPPDTVLLITCTQWDRRSEGAWVKAVEQAGVYVPVWPLKPHELPGWIGERMRSRGLAATPDAIALLAGRVEGNLLAAAQEIDKLAVLHGEGRLDAATLEQLVADSARYDAFRLSDAAFGGDGARALRVLAGLRGEGEDLIPLLGWLISQLGIAARLAAARDFAAAARAEGLWQAREQLFRKALKRAPADHWARCLMRAGSIDRMAKGRASGDPWRELERLVVAIAEPRAAAALA
ncbi:DNA polymerase III, delta subunit [Mizugakiibacter sediminis]|uniref:DNA polymerase III subunit delta n=1 Tax=Mizugakiibacter sediminis TaxID=1475481 RepID=A0A0K8QPA9_9GAMM|nr:DNA polymerase III subunit delta [Mizugakiibacter sediminis]GAP66247.1 DNA polymerase III, delta subunit [Mizugakiibacter sediminis]